MLPRKIPAKMPATMMLLSLPWGWVFKNLKKRPALLGKNALAYYASKACQKTHIFALGPW
jgi:hypothetical protein